VLIDNQILTSLFLKGGGGGGEWGGDFWNLEPSFQQRSVWFCITSLIVLITNQILTSLIGKKKRVCDFFLNLVTFSQQRSCLSNSTYRKSNINKS
jgi:hypothetical protein